MVYAHIRAVPAGDLHNLVGELMHFDPDVGPPAPKHTDLQPAAVGKSFVGPCDRSLCSESDRFGVGSGPRSKENCGDLKAPDSKDEELDRAPSRLATAANCYTFTFHGSKYSKSPGCFSALRAQLGSPSSWSPHTAGRVRSRLSPPRDSTRTPRADVPGTLLMRPRTTHTATSRTPSYRDTASSRR